MQRAIGTICFGSLIVALTPVSQASPIAAMGPSDYASTVAQNTDPSASPSALPATSPASSAPPPIDPTAAPTATSATSATSTPYPMRTPTVAPTDEGLTFDEAVKTCTDPFDAYNYSLTVKRCAQDIIRMAPALDAAKISGDRRARLMTRYAMYIFEYTLALARKQTGDTNSGRENAELAIVWGFLAVAVDLFADPHGYNHETRGLKKEFTDHVKILEAAYPGVFAKEKALIDAKLDAAPSRER